MWEVRLTVFSNFPMAAEQVLVNLTRQYSNINHKYNKYWPITCSIEEIKTKWYIQNAKVNFGIKWNHSVNTAAGRNVTRIRNGGRFIWVVCDQWEQNAASCWGFLVSTFYASPCSIKKEILLNFTMELYHTVHVLFFSLMFCFHAEVSQTGLAIILVLCKH